MGNAFKIGRAFGIDLKVHWAFFLLPAIVGFLAYRGTQSLAATALSIGIVVALFVCVLLHELGHSVVAQRLGIDVQDITLLPIGGLARMKSIPEKPGDEIKIAVAGPLVNVVLAPLFLVPAVLLGLDLTSFVNPLFGQVGSVSHILFYLGALNVFLAVFNMLPAFPMDGGRVLRGILAIRFGPVRATNISATVGQMLAAAGFVLGIFFNPVLILIAVFVFFGASGEAQMVRQRETMRGLSVADVMGTKRRTETITPYHNFGQVLDAVIHGYQEDFPVVDESGNLVGIVTRNEIMSAAHSSDKFLTVRDLMKTEYPTVSPEADLFQDGQRLLQESGMRALPVLRDGELVGMLTTEDVGQASLLREASK
ncbi:site-2 protease family protein [Rubrobacter aplysinae]|uniref:site-2 protease family protein n=1 Tax=Rubrobacter aplysinae TaxID=909625 RepID=UPI00064BED05|nr:site-2 protease family protein [Rubrobacter aplysinae]